MIQIFCACLVFGKLTDNTHIFCYKNHECIVNIIVKIIKICSPIKQAHCIVNQFSTFLHKENCKEKIIGRNVMYNGNGYYMKLFTAFVNIWQYESVCFKNESEH